jgi:hypothetical protein
MHPNVPRTLQAADYEREAQAYLRSLPLEHFMEAIPQATQRKITLESLDLVKARRPDVQVYNELLVQYPVAGRRKLGQVVPDNMVVLSTEPAQSEGSYNVPLEAARPFWVLEYVSPGNPRKDYEDSFDKYEKDLKVPYYLLFYPDTQNLTLYRHNRRRTSASSQTGGGATRSASWSWRWACWTVGCASGSRANSSRCRPTCSATWTRPGRN